VHKILLHSRPRLPLRPEDPSLTAPPSGYQCPFPPTSVLQLSSIEETFNFSSQHFKQHVICCVHCTIPLATRQLITNCMPLSCTTPQCKSISIHPSTHPNLITRFYDMHLAFEPRGKPTQHHVCANIPVSSLQATRQANTTPRLWGLRKKHLYDHPRGCWLARLRTECHFRSLEHSIGYFFV